MPSPSTSSTTARVALPLATLALGLAGGYWLRTDSSPTTQGAAAHSAAASVEGSHADVAVVSAPEDQQRATAHGSAESVKTRVAAGVWKDTRANRDALEALPAAALAKLADELSGSLRHPFQTELRRAFFSTWASKDPKAALAFVEKQASSAMKEEMRLGAMQGWAGNDLRSFLGWVEDLPEGGTLHAAVRLALPLLVSSDPRAALGLTERLPLNFRSSAYADIFSSWVLTDPTAASAALGSLTMADRDRRTVQATLVAGWAISDPKSALAWAGQLPAGAQRLDALQTLASVWTETDPDGALKQAGTLAEGAEKRRFMEAIVNSWPADRIGEAFEVASKVPNLMQRDNLSITALEHWSRTDPDGAFRRIQEMAPGAFRNRALQALTMQLSATDPERAFALARAEIRDNGARAEALNAAVDGMAQRDPSKVVDLLASLPPGQDRAHAIVSACRTLSDVNPEAGSRLLQLLPPGTERTDAAINLAFGMTSRDPEAAKQWAMSLPEGGPRTESLLVITSGLMETDPAAAARWAATLGEADGRVRIQERIANEWAQKDPQAAIAWMRGLSDSEVRTKALASAVEALAYTDPQQALWLTISEGATDPAKLHLALGSLAKQWSRQDLERAAAAARDLPSEALQSSYVGHLLEQVSDTDPKKAIDLLSRFGDIPLDVDLVGSVVTNWARKDPAAAADWVGGFEDAGVRDMATRTVIQEWALQAPRAAGEWVAALPPAAGRDQLLVDFVDKIARDHSDLAVTYARAIQDTSLRDASLQRLGKK